MSAGWFKPAFNVQLDVHLLNYQTFLNGSWRVTVQPSVCPCPCNQQREGEDRFSVVFYLLTTLLYGEGEFAHHHVYTLQCGLLQLLDLLFHYSLKGQVRGEQTRPVGRGRRHGR